MKTKDFLFTVTVLTVILCIPALGRTELPEPVLLAQPNPTLAGIEDFYVFIVQPDSEPNKDGLVFPELQRKVEHKLEEAGVKFVTPRSFPTPELRVYIDMLKLPDSQKYVFRIQISLTRTVTLLKQQNLHFPVDVWKTKPKMQAVSVKDMPAEVTNVVLEQVEAFIHAYLAANPKGVQPADANDIKAVSQKRRAGPVTKSAVTEYKYVASKNSKVFHKPDCSSVKRIKPENIVGYNNRDEALEAGKRPCKICKP